MGLWWGGWCLGWVWGVKVGRRVTGHSTRQRWGMPQHSAAACRRPSLRAARAVRLGAPPAPEEHVLCVFPTCREVAPDPTVPADMQLGGGGTELALQLWWVVNHTTDGEAPGVNTTWDITRPEIYKAYVRWVMRISQLGEGAQRAKRASGWLGPPGRACLVCWQGTPWACGHCVPGPAVHSSPLSRGQHSSRFPQQADAVRRRLPPPTTVHLLLLSEANVSMLKQPPPPACCSLPQPT